MRTRQAAPRAPDISRRGERITVRTYDGELIIRRIWAVYPDIIDICDDEGYQKLLHGETWMPIGFPTSAVMSAREGREGGTAMIRVYGIDYTAFPIPAACESCGGRPPTLLYVERSPALCRPIALCDTCATREHNISAEHLPRGVN